ncbi:MAG: peptide chain release factor N(5)-glutamine methyltransferase [Altererythrobacter sp.]|nr:peptide chain release factor N(5)-glutamine methyltransferase [Altererythrobacter sp.]
MADTLGGALREATARLVATGSDTARMDAELLLAHAAGTTRTELFLLCARGDGPEPAGFAALVERRAGGEPVAYILGHQDFYGRSFRVTPDVLIPRSDTESVVAAALAAAPQPNRILDLGTGSGAMLVTCLLERPGALGVGTDASAAALAVAENNAQRLGLTRRHTRFLQRDWLADGWAADLGLFDLIVANPPYVEDDAELDASVRDFEPAQALFAGPEGLDDYRALIPQLPALLAPGGVAVLEIGYRQAAAVTAIAEAQGFAVELHPDLAGRDRTVILRRSCG